jgi:hypothetical protein
MAISYPLINGLRRDWSSVELSILEQGGTGEPPPPLRGFTSLDYEITCTAENLYGAGGSDPIGQTRGRAEYTCSVKLYDEEWTVLRDQLGKGYGEKVLRIVATWTENNETETVTIVGRITKVGKSSSRDSVPERTIDILPISIVEGDGITMLNK